MPIYTLKKSQVKKAGIIPKDGVQYLITIPPVPDAGFNAAIYHVENRHTSDAQIIVDKEITFEEAFKL